MKWKNTPLSSPCGQYSSMELSSWEGLRAPGWPVLNSSSSFSKLETVWVSSSRSWRVE